MTETLSCPTCGAPLDYAGKGETLRCPYCNNSVIVPAELRSSAHSAHGFQAGGNESPDQAYQNEKIMKGVVLLAQTGKTIEAIKLYRQMTNCDLAEAKAAVDNLRAGRPIQAANEPQFEVLAGTTLPADQKAEIWRLLHTHQKIEAIKFYRQKTGVGLKEAKDAVEAMDPAGQLAKPGNTIKGKLLKIVISLFFIAIASIFPIVFTPMGITSWQDHQMGAAIGAFIAAGIWALVWGGIGIAVLFL